MGDDTSKSSPLEFLKHIGGWITAFIGFVTTLVNFIKLVQGDTELVTKVLLTSGIVVLWLSFFYIYFRKVLTGESLGIRGYKRPAYPKWARYLALAGIIAVPILTTVGFLGWKYYPPDKIIILIANFDGPDPKNYRVTETIVEQLREATKEYSDVRVEALGETITPQDGSEVARAKGKERKASIVLWGWYGKTKEKAPVTAHFEVLKQPRRLSLRQEKETLIMAVAELESFEIQGRLSGEMIYLTLLTIGLARYEAQDYDGAIDRFTNALIQPTVPEQMISPADVYFYRGNAYVNKGDLDHAITDFNKAIILEPDLAVGYNNRGITYANKGDYAQAAADFDQAIVLKPDLAEAYSNRGNTYYSKGNYDQAIADFDQAIKLKPGLAEAYNNRGNAYREKSDYDQAIADYNQAVALQPDLAVAYNNRGVAYKDKGDYDQAIALRPSHQTQTRLG
jgi:tetratricopeptide (TPR) repeat protein